MACGDALVGREEAGPPDDGERELESELECDGEDLNVGFASVRTTPAQAQNRTHIQQNHRKRNGTSRQSAWSLQHSNRWRKQTDETTNQLRAPWHVWRAFERVVAQVLAVAYPHWSQAVQATAEWLTQWKR